MHVKIPHLLLLPLLMGIWYAATGFRILEAAVFFGVIMWLVIVLEEWFGQWLEKRATRWVDQHRSHPAVRWIERSVKNEAIAQTRFRKTP